MMAKMACALAAAFAVAVLAAGEADAQSRRVERDTGTVRVCGTYNSGCTSAPVRRGRNGDQIRLPSGTWIDCRGNCRDTLREEALDFWETQKESQPF